MVPFQVGTAIWGWAPLDSHDTSMSHPNFRIQKSAGQKHLSQHPRKSYPSNLSNIHPLMGFLVFLVLHFRWHPGPCFQNKQTPLKTTGWNRKKYPLFPRAKHPEKPNSFEFQPFVFGNVLPSFELFQFGQLREAPYQPGHEQNR